MSVPLGKLYWVEDAANRRVLAETSAWPDNGIRPTEFDVGITYWISAGCVPGNILGACQTEIGIDSALIDFDDCQLFLLSPEDALNETRSTIG